MEFGLDILKRFLIRPIFKCWAVPVLWLMLLVVGIYFTKNRIFILLLLTFLFSILSVVTYVVYCFLPRRMAKAFLTAVKKGIDDIKNKGDQVA